MTTKTVSVPRDLCSKKAFELGLGMMNGPLENFQDRKHHISGSELWKLEYISKIKKKLSGTYPNSINLGCPRNNISLCDMDNNLFSLETCLLGPDFFFHSFAKKPIHLIPSTRNSWLFSYLLRVPNRLTLRLESSQSRGPEIQRYFGSGHR